MKFDRAYRRTQTSRLKNNRKNYWAYGLSDYFDRGQMPSRILGIVVNTPHPCSKYCCGNPRKWFGSKTMQEIKFSIVCKELD